jgi:hypothetical protein
VPSTARLPRLPALDVLALEALLRLRVGLVALNTYVLRMVSAGPQGVPGEPPDGGVWEGRKVAAYDEAGAIEAAAKIFPGWTVLTVQEYNK